MRVAASGGTAVRGCSAVTASVAVGGAAGVPLPPAAFADVNLPLADRVGAALADAALGSARAERAVAVRDVVVRAVEVRVDAALAGAALAGVALVGVALAGAALAGADLGAAGAVLVGVVPVRAEVGLLAAVLVGVARAEVDLVAPAPVFVVGAGVPPFTEPVRVPVEPVEVVLVAVFAGAVLAGVDLVLVDLVAVSLAAAVGPFSTVAARDEAGLATVADLVAVPRAPEPERVVAGGAMPGSTVPDRVVVDRDVVVREGAVRVLVDRDVEARESDVAVERPAVVSADLAVDRVPAARAPAERVPAARAVADREALALEPAALAVAAFFTEVRREVVDSRTPESDPPVLRAGMLAAACFRAGAVVCVRARVPAVGCFPAGDPATGCFPAEVPATDCFPAGIPAAGCFPAEVPAVDRFPAEIPAAACLRAGMIAVVSFRVREVAAATRSPLFFRTGKSSPVARSWSPAVLAAAAGPFTEPIGGAAILPVCGVPTAPPGSVTADASCGVAAVPLGGVVTAEAFCGVAAVPPGGVTAVALGGAAMASGCGVAVVPVRFAVVPLAAGAVSSSDGEAVPAGRATGSSGARRGLAVVWSPVDRSSAAARGAAEPFVAFAITKARVPRADACHRRFASTPPNRRGIGPTSRAGGSDRRRRSASIGRKAQLNRPRPVLWVARISSSSCPITAIDTRPTDHRCTIAPQPSHQTGGPSRRWPFRRGHAYGRQPSKVRVCWTITGAGPPAFGHPT